MNFSEITAVISASVIGLSAFVGAAYQLMSHGSRFNQWRSTRIEHQRTLAKLAAGADSLLDAVKAMGEIRCDIHSNEIKKVVSLTGELGEHIETLRSITKETIEHNQRQDCDIAESKQEREIHTKALFALLSGQQQQGLNGPVTAAYDEIKHYLISKTHSA